MNDLVLYMCLGVCTPVKIWRCQYSQPGAKLNTYSSSFMAGNSNPADSAITREDVEIFQRLLQTFKVLQSRESQRLSSQTTQNTSLPTESSDMLHPETMSRGQNDADDAHSHDKHSEGVEGYEDDMIDGSMREDLSEGSDSDTDRYDMNDTDDFEDEEMNRGMHQGNQEGGRGGEREDDISAPDVDMSVGDESSPRLSSAESSRADDDAERHKTQLYNTEDLCCWNDGCNGREFLTKSNLVRHWIEKCNAHSTYCCPSCGAVFNQFELQSETRRLTGAARIGFDGIQTGESGSASG